MLVRGSALLSDRDNLARWLQHIVADLAGNRMEILSNINFGLTVNALEGRDVLRQRHCTLC